MISGDGEGDYDVTASPIAPGKHDEIEREEGKEELTKHTPEVRMAIYREMAEQKKEKEDRQKENLPKERNFENEQVVVWEIKMRYVDLVLCAFHRRSCHREEQMDHVLLATRCVGFDVSLG